MYLRLNCKSSKKLRNICLQFDVLLIENYKIDDPEIFIHKITIEW